MEYYWHLETWEKEIIKVTPDPQKIKYIQDLISKGEGTITTPTRSITIKSIKDFRLSDEPYTDQKLLEESNAAFDEPTITKDGIKTRWVKKAIPRRRYDNHYRHIPAYRVLEESSDSILITFKQPVHQIDHERVQELSATEEMKLSKRTA